MPVPQKHFNALYHLFSSIKNEKEAAALLEDLLSPKEVASIAERWQIIRELAKGTPQREIAKKLGISISKITRGSRVLQYGKGGVQKFLS